MRFGGVPERRQKCWTRCRVRYRADRRARVVRRKGRALVAGMLNATSARDGRMLAISILGNSPLTAELVQRREDPSVVVHAYQAPAGCALDDEAAWRAANPGLGTIKSLSYMRDMARRAAALPSAGPFARASRCC